MKYIFILVFGFGMVAGIWTTGQSVSIDKVVAQEWSVSNDSQIVFLGNLKIGNPLGGITCNKETLDKATQTIDKAGKTLNIGMDKVNQSLDKANNNLETGNGLYNSSDFNFTSGKWLGFN